MTPLARRLQGLTISKRHPRWREHYPQDFWTPWHMSLLGHDQVPQQRPTSFMDALYRTNTQRSDAALELLGFERRTVLGHLPPHTGVTPDLLQGLAEELDAARDLRAFWTSLEAHFDKHVTRGDSGPFLAAASRACLSYLRSLTDLSPMEARDLDPGEVDSPLAYARLARLITLLAVTPDRPFSFSLYCASSDYEPLHALALNVRVPQTFLSRQGVLAEREVLLGVTLAGKDEVPGPGGGVLVPTLVPDQYFSTLFAPTPRMGGRMYDAGRSCILTL